MNDLLINFRTPLKTFQDVEKRCRNTEKIKKHLSFVSNGNWRALYRAEFDGSYWIEEYPFSEMHGGGPPCLYSAETDEPELLLDNHPYLTSDIRAMHDAEAFWDILGDENGPEICKQKECARKRISKSVFCKVHHYENVRNEPCPLK
jgi:hypothetical protein